jgi:hypothetical protein
MLQHQSEAWKACRGNGPFTRFGQSPSPTNSTKTPFWTNFTASAPNGFVTQLAMYLDTSAGNQLVQDTRVDYSVALDSINGAFVQVSDLTLRGFCYWTAVAASSGSQHHTQASM